jgi:hypothetical protein
MVRGRFSAFIEHYRRPDKVDTLESLNERIKRLNCYGIRTITAAQSCYRITWSNSGTCWIKDYYKTRKGAKVTLDANQTIAFMDKKTLESILNQLEQLPLYGNSFEAIYRR